MNQIAGAASGWSVYPYYNGGWSWSAYGPRGGNTGWANTKADAERSAQRAAEDLRAPRIKEA